MLRENVKNIDGIIFTHEHKDHTGGLDDIRAFNYIKQSKLDIFAEERVQKSLRQEFAYVFAEKKYPGIPEVNMITICDEPFSFDNLKVIPIRTMHYHLPIFGFRIGNFCYITDTNYISEEEKKKIKGSTHIVVAGLRKQKHLAHYTLNEAIALIQEMKPEMGYITHCSHQLGLYKDIQKEMPDGIMLAYDGLKIEI
jgi:phosphoribosyl 1,2-cyclic phosphate phosphodiesterase